MIQRLGLVHSSQRRQCRAKNARLTSNDSCIVDPSVARCMNVTLVPTGVESARSRISFTMQSFLAFGPSASFRNFRSATINQNIKSIAGVGAGRRPLINGCIGIPCDRVGREQGNAQSTVKASLPGRFSCQSVTALQRVPVKFGRLKRGSYGGMVGSAFTMLLAEYQHRLHRESIDNRRNCHNKPLDQACRSCSALGQFSWNTSKGVALTFRSAACRFVRLSSLTHQTFNVRAA